MKTNRTIKSLTRIAAAVAFIAVFRPVPSQAAGKPQSTAHVELSMTGEVFTLPDHTARIYPGISEWDQCREAGLDATSLGQRLTTMNLFALGFGGMPFETNLPYPAAPGEIRRAIRLDFGTKTAGPGKPVIFSFFVTSHCQFFVRGFIVSGQWPLQAGTPGPDLVVAIPAGAEWSFQRYGGGAAECSGSATLNDDVTITIRRNEARTSNLCDCPNEYKDAEAATCP